MNYHYSHDVAAEMLGKENPDELDQSLIDHISDIRTLIRKTDRGDLTRDEVIAVAVQNWRENQRIEHDQERWRTSHEEARRKVRDLDLDVDGRRSHDVLIEALEEYYEENEEATTAPA